MIKTTLSPALHSQNTSRAPTPDSLSFTTRSATHNSPYLKRPLSSSSPHQDKRPFHNPPMMKQPSLRAPNTLQLPPINPPAIFYPEVNQTRFIPKMLLNPLDLGDEIQWARLTQTMLEEFSYIALKLKLKALTQHLAWHPAAKQAAEAQLLQAIQDPLHDPLNGFFTWLFHSYSLSRLELNTNLRKAVEQQKFDWSINPAIDLQKAIAQVHMSLDEINKNEMFRETLQDTLKVKLHPHYHLVADTPIPKLPEKLRFIWKNIVVPPIFTNNLTSFNESTILKYTSPTDINLRIPSALKSHYVSTNPTEIYKWITHAWVKHYTRTNLHNTSHTNHFQSTIAISNTRCNNMFFSAEKQHMLQHLADAH